jgi:hypothetical protein
MDVLHRDFARRTVMCDAANIQPSAGHAAEPDFVLRRFVHELDLKRAIARAHRRAKRRGELRIDGFARDPATRR